MARSTETKDFVLGLQDAARRTGLAINVGVHEPGDDATKVKNVLLWIDEHGDIAARYQKIHLFDVNIEGGPSLMESESVEKGMRILPPFETPIGRVGMAICFDVRHKLIRSVVQKQQHLCFLGRFSLQLLNESSYAFPR